MSIILITKKEMKGKYSKLSQNIITFFDKIHHFSYESLVLLLLGVNYIYRPFFYIKIVNFIKLSLFL